MRIERVNVTPELAAKLLENNQANRNLRKEVVNLYAEQMLTHRWKQGTSETIKVSSKGRLLDGQHRLHAVIKAGVSVEFTIAFGLDESVFDVIDTGLVRNASDTLNIAGHKHYAQIPSIINYHHIIKEGKVKGRRGLTNAQIIECLQSRPDFWYDVVNKAKRWSEAFGYVLNASIVGGIFSVVVEINREQAESFFDQVCIGFDIENRTIGMLRQKLIQDKTSVRRMDTHVRCAYILKTWNFYRAGQTPKLLKFTPSEERFPVPV